MRRDLVILGFVALGLLLRLYLASTTIYLWDEEGDWIPLAANIHIGDGATHLPLRGYFHGILPAYLIRLGSLIAGTGPIGYRLASVLAGTATILVVARLAYVWRGLAAARIAALLVAINQYHVGISALATEKVFNLLFAAMALLAFVQFVRTQRSSYMMLTAVMCGLAVLAKETGYLLVGVIGLYMLLSSNRKWFARREAWLAIGLFTLVILPDVIGATFAKERGIVAYEEHLDRIGGIGFTPYYLSFFLRSVAPEIYSFLGRRFVDYTEEYPSMSVVSGLLLLGSSFLVLISAFRRSDHPDPDRNIHLVLFWGILFFFMALRPSHDTRLNPVVWFWVDLTLLPGVILTAAVCSALWRRARVPVALAVALMAGYSVSQTVVHRLRLPAGPKMGLYPHDLPVTEQAMIEVHAAILHCATCSIEDAKLVDVEARLPNGVWMSAVGTPLVAGAAPGTDDRSFLVAASSRNRPRGYRVTYDVTLSDGSTVELTQELHPLRDGASAPPVRPWTVPDERLHAFPASPRSAIPQ